MNRNELNKISLQEYLTLRSSFGYKYLWYIWRYQYPAMIVKTVRLADRLILQKLPQLRTFLIKFGIMKFYKFIRGSGN